ncbi:MAG TPA: peptidoglycan DD-metalloendopeptidase family protein [Blastocatellia bacterium]|nr:peptidoglycan DD-metalloendopeptidase family protein [Blastocatellia bacterium]
MVRRKIDILPDTIGCATERVNLPPSLAAASQAKEMANRAPSATVVLEPMESGKAVYLPLAPKFEGAKAQVKIILACLITNNETSDLALSNVTFSFPGSSISPKNMQGENLVTPPIEPGKSAWWSNGVVKLSETETISNALYLDAPAPAKVEVTLTFSGYSKPIKVNANLAPHKSPAPTGGWLFPFSASDLRAGEYFSASAQHWANGGGKGRQIYAHDIGCVAWDAEKQAFSGLLPGKDKTKNENYRIWGKPVRALADGTVESWHDGMEANTPPGFPDPTPDPVGGNHLWIKHGDELIIYTHLQKNSIPAAFKVKGAVVKAGQKVGLAGNSGNSSNPHEHVEAAQTGNTSLRPLPFREAWICEATSLQPPSPEGPWVRLDAEGIPFDSVLIWPAATRPAWYPPGWAEVSHHGIPEAQYQTIFNRAFEAGYRPVWVDGYEVSGKTFFNVIFRPRAGSPAWAARHNLDGAGYQAEFDKHTKEGYRLLNLSSYLVGGHVRYACIFVKTGGPAWVAYHGQTAEQHQARVDSLGPDGFRPTNVSVVSVNGQRSYAAFWEKKNVGSWLLKSFLTENEYQQQWDDNSAAGRRVAYLSACNHNGEPRISAVFQQTDIEGNEATTAGRHHLTSDQYQAEYESRLSQGYLTRCVAGYSLGASARFAAIWRKP